MSMTTDNDAQPQYDVKPSNQRSNVSAYVRWQPTAAHTQTREAALADIAAHLESPEFATFVKLVGKDTAYGYIRRVLEHKSNA